MNRIVFLISKNMNVINQVVPKLVCQCSRKKLTIKLVFDRDEKKQVTCWWVLKLNKLFVMNER